MVATFGAGSPGLVAGQLFDGVAEFALATSVAARSERTIGACGVRFMGAASVGKRRGRYADFWCVPGNSVGCGKRQASLPQANPSAARTPHHAASSKIE